jgi:transposase
VIYYGILPLSLNNELSNENTANISIPYTNNASLKLRYLAVQKFHDGHSRTSIAKTLNVSRRLVNEWITKYLSGGLNALALKLSTGQPSRLSNEQKVQLKEYVIGHRPCCQSTGRPVNG